MLEDDRVVRSDGRDGDIEKGMFSESRVLSIVVEDRGLRTLRFGRRRPLRLQINAFPAKSRAIALLLLPLHELLRDEGPRLHLDLRIPFPFRGRGGVLEEVFEGDGGEGEIGVRCDLGFLLDFCKGVFEDSAVRGSPSHGPIVVIFHGDGGGRRSGGWDVNLRHGSGGWLGSIGVTMVMEETMMIGGWR